MKTPIGIIFALIVIAFAACKKDKDSTDPIPANEKFSSVYDFFSKNGPALQTYTVDGSAGGNFTTPQGTKVTIPANAFVTQSNTPVTGTVTIQFKDIYKKSDMLLADMPTMIQFGEPLKSGGEFFIKAIANNSALVLANGKKISVEQPAALTGGVDTANVMLPFVQQDTLAINIGWVPVTYDSVLNTATSYVYSMYQFSNPVDSGTWGNSDNPTFFSMYPQTNLTIHPNDSNIQFGTEVFLVFNDISSMVHVYYYSPSFSFPYNYSPIGLQCTVVAVGVKDSTLYSSFTPITISANQSLNFSLSPTTVDDFISQLKGLD